MKKILLVIALIFCSFSLALPFDKEPGQFPEYFPPEEIAKGYSYFDLQRTFVNIYCIGTGEGVPLDDSSRIISGSFALQGSGVYLDKGYIITNAHVIKPTMIELEITDSFYHVVEIQKVTSQIILIGGRIFEGTVGATVEWVSEEYDIAILKIQGTWLPAEPLKYPIVRTFGWGPYGGYNLLREGDALAMITQVREEDGSELWYYGIQWGNVISTHPEFPPSPELENWWVSWLSPNDVTMSVNVQPGDSGTPIFAFDQGKPILVGLARAYAVGYKIQTWTSDDGRIVEIVIPIFHYYMTRVDPAIPFLKAHGVIE